METTGNPCRTKADNAARCMGRHQTQETLCSGMEWQLEAATVRCCAPHPDPLMLWPIENALCSRAALCTVSTHQLVTLPCMLAIGNADLPYPTLVSSVRLSSSAPFANQSPRRLIRRICQCACIDILGFRNPYWGVTLPAMLAALCSCRRQLAEGQLRAFSATAPGKH